MHIKQNSNRNKNSTDFLTLRKSCDITIDLLDKKVEKSNLIINNNNQISENKHKEVDVFLEKHYKKINLYHFQNLTTSESLIVKSPKYSINQNNPIKSNNIMIQKNNQRFNALIKGTNIVSYKNNNKFPNKSNIPKLIKSFISENNEDNNFSNFKEINKYKINININKKQIQKNSMENCDSFSNNISKNQNYGNNKANKFLNLNISKTQLKSSNLTNFKETINKRNSKLESEVDQEKLEIEVLNTTNDIFTDENDNSPKKEVNNKGNLICQNRIIEPILSTSKGFVDKFGESNNRVSNFKLPNSKNKRNLINCSKSPIKEKNNNDCHDFLNSNNNSKDKVNLENQNYYENKDVSKFTDKFQNIKEIDPIKMGTSNLLKNKINNNSSKNQINFNNKINNKCNSKENQILNLDRFMNNSNKYDYFIQKANGKNSNDNYFQNNIIPQKEKDYIHKLNDDSILQYRSNQEINKIKNHNLKNMNKNELSSDKEKLEKNLMLNANSKHRNNLKVNYFSNNNQETNLNLNSNKKEINDYIKIMNKFQTDNLPPITKGDFINKGNSEKVNFNKTIKKVQIPEENKNYKNSNQNIFNGNRNLNINLKPEQQYNFIEESDDSLDELREKDTYENIQSKILENRNLQNSYTNYDSNFNYFSKGLESLKDSNEINYVKKFFMLSDDSLNRFVNKAKITLKQNTLNNSHKNFNFNVNNFKTNNKIKSNESYDDFNLEENLVSDGNYIDKKYNLLDCSGKYLSNQLLPLKEKKEEFPYYSNNFDNKNYKDDYSTNFKSENRFLGNENLDLSLSKISKDLGKTKINDNQKQVIYNNIGFKTFPNKFFKNLTNKGIINNSKGIMSKSNINIDNLHSKFSNDIDAIITNLRNKNKNHSKEKIITNNDNRKKSSILKNKETNSNTSSLNSEGITSGKTEDKIASISNRRLEILKKNLGISQNAKQNADKTKEYGTIIRSGRYQNEKNVPKIQKIQSIFRGYLFRKLYIKCFKNYENLNKLIELYLQISNENNSRIQKLFFKNFKAKITFMKLENCKMLLNFLNKFISKKRKANKEFSFRQIYLNSFSKKISNDLEKENIKQINKNIEKQKTQFLQAQKEKDKNNRSFKFLIFITNFSNLKMMRNKTILLKQLKNIQIAKNSEEQKKFASLKKLVLYYNRKFNLINSQEYLSLYLKVVLIDWKSRLKKAFFNEKMILRKFLLEKILLLKLKTANDEKEFIDFIENKNQKIENLSIENLYFNLIKKSFKTLITHLNKKFFDKINLENKSTKILFALQKLIFNKENKEKLTKKLYLNKFKEFSIDYKIKTINKKKEILQVLIQKYTSSKSIKDLKATLSIWRDISIKLFKIKDILLKILSIKLSQNIQLAKYCFEKYKTKTKKQTNHMNGLSIIFENVNSLQNRIKSECFKKIFNKLKILIKWNNNSNDIKIINFNCSLNKETYENQKKSFLEEIEILKENDNQEFLLETNLRFKRINYLWKMSDEKNFQINLLRYYLFKFYNKAKSLFLEDLKQNSIKWNYITYYKNTNYRNKSESSNDEDEENLEITKECFTKQSMKIEKSNLEANFAANSKKSNKVNKLIPNILQSNIIGKQESGVNDVLIINKYKRDLLKELGIQNISQNNISFETTKRTDIPVSEKQQSSSNINSEISNISKCMLEFEIPKNDFSIETDISLIHKKNNQDKNFDEEAESNKEKQIKEYKNAFNVLEKIFKFKLQEIFFVLICQLRYIKFNNYALLIKKTFKNFLQNIRKKKEMEKEEKKFNEITLGDELNTQDNPTLTLDNITVFNIPKINFEHENCLDDLSYSDTVIDLVRVIQFYVYDKKNPINKNNYLMRIFNRWRYLSKVKSKDIDKNTSVSNDKGFFSLSKSIPKEIEFKSKDQINICTKKLDNIKLSNFLLEENPINNFDIKKSRKHNSLPLYKNYLNKIKIKIEKFIEKIEMFTLKDIIKNLKSIKKEDSSEEIILTGTSNIPFETDKNNKSCNDFKIYQKSRNNSKTSNLNLNPNSNKKSSTSHKEIPKLVIFSFDLNLSNNFNNNNLPTFVKKNSMLVTDNSFNFQTNRTSINYESNNNFRKNFNNQSYSQNQTYNNYNTCNNHSIGNSKNLTFNSELKSDEEPDEINEIKISCAIEIQNFWRDYKIQKYILALVDKMKYIDKFIKTKYYKLKNSMMLSFIQWKKKIFINKIIEKAKLIQRFFRKRKFRKNNLFKKN